MKSRSGIQVMAGLIGMIRPLLSKMCLAVLMGCVGNLMATFITVLGAYGLTTLLGLTGGLKLSVIFTLLAVFSVLRGILRYAEQARPKCCWTCFRIALPTENERPLRLPVGRLFWS